MARFDEQEEERLRGTELNLDAADPVRAWGGASVYEVDLDQSRAAVGFWLASAR
ncbi:hypothetical protein SMC26_35490 [Actinomadura fulvescens]